MDTRIAQFGVQMRICGTTKSVRKFVERIRTDKVKPSRTFQNEPHGLILVQVLICGSLISLKPMYISLSLRDKSFGMISLSLSLSNFLFHLFLLSLVLHILPISFMFFMEKGLFY